MQAQVAEYLPDRLRLLAREHEERAFVASWRPRWLRGIGRARRQRARVTAKALREAAEMIETYCDLLRARGLGR